MLQQPIVLNPNPSEAGGGAGVPHSGAGATWSAQDGQAPSSTPQVSDSSTRTHTHALTCAQAHTAASCPMRMKSVVCLCWQSWQQPPASLAPQKAAEKPATPWEAAFEQHLQQRHQPALPEPVKKRGAGGATVGVEKHVMPSAGEWRCCRVVSLWKKLCHLSHCVA